MSPEDIYYEEEIIWFKLCCGLYDADYALYTTKWYYQS